MPAGSSRTGCATRFASRSGPGRTRSGRGDVGWNVWEEINRIQNPTDPTLENFGWPCYEGAFTDGNPPASIRQSGYDGANIPICENLYAPGEPNVVAPYYAYNHSAKVVPAPNSENCPAGGSSISGLAFYQGGSYPDNYDGALFFSDYSRGCIWVMFPGGNGLPDPSARAKFVDGSPGVKEVGPDGPRDRSRRRPLLRRLRPWDRSPGPVRGPAAADARTRRRLLLQRGHRDERRRRLGDGERRDDRDGDLDDAGQVRKRALLQRHERAGDGPRRALTAADERR